jgi:hypothetical protein
MPIPLAKKNNDQPTATDDVQHSALAADPTITQFPVNSTFGQQLPSTTIPLATNTVITQPAAPTTVLTGAGTNAAQGAEVLVENDNSDFINKKWRPLMAFVYMFTCLCDFVVFPVLWSLLQALSKGSVTVQWQPLTLQGAGLYHIAMGAVLGVAAYGRTKEKLEGKS